MRRGDVVALLIAVTVTAILGAAMVYFVLELWPLLPPALSLVVFILLAVLVIGYPIYALARLSDRYLARLKKGQGTSPRDEDRKR